MASEHVEMEQVPLKSDTDKPAGAEDGHETKTEGLRGARKSQKRTGHYRDRREEAARHHNEIQASLQPRQERRAKGSRRQNRCVRTDL